MAAERKLRVCLLSEGFYPEVLGGMELHAHALAERLWDLGVECEALARPVRPETPALHRAGRITVRHAGVPGQLKGAGLAAALPLARFSAGYGAWLVRRRGRFDVVMALGSKTTPVPGLVARALAGLPLVLVPQTAHEFAEPISAESLARGGALARGLLPSWKRLRGLMLRRADAVVAISDEVARSLRALGVPEARIERIPNGIDLGRFRPAEPGRRRELRARLGLPPDRAVLAYVGRIARGKGVLTLADVWADLPDHHRRDAHLVMVGSGGGSFDDCEAELRAVVAGRGLAGTVTLAGATDDVPAYLRAADAFVFPSEHEGFGLALLEAMACGLPVVTAEVGVAGEVVADPAHGRLVPPRDPAAFRAAVEDLLACRADWPAMGAAARAAVAEAYGMDAVAARYARLLRRVAAGGGGPA